MIPAIKATVNAIAKPAETGRCGHLRPKKRREAAARSRAVAPAVNHAVAYSPWGIRSTYS